ncbi:MAG: imidazoleglycerol-phosphate dehydratase HisB [Epsilonproteobacteria bacterium]|nr:MAG: imidazoleglycerol-phosphate dehydratase HisB [Campylobacterota bacterium]
MVKLNRETKETTISCEVNIHDDKQACIDTGIGFFDHMLETLSKHSGTYISLQCKGDLHIDAHHTVEDCAIVLGQAIAQEIHPISSIRRFATSTVVMDEASSTTNVDISNRAFLVYDIGEATGKVGQLDIELVEEFFNSFITNSKITAHIMNNRGKNKHHIVESMFKSFAIAFKTALEKNDSGSVPSTKGVL